MVYDGKELQIYISDLLPDVQMKVLSMYGVYPDDRNLSAIINCKPLCVIPEAKLPEGLDHPADEMFPEMRTRRRSQSREPRYRDMQVPYRSPDVIM